MAKLNFAQRYRQDQRFRDAVEDLVKMEILKMAGLSPEELVEQWETNRRLEVPGRKQVPSQPTASPKPQAAPKAPAAKKATRKRTTKPQDS
jgi:hypothetical protein